MRDISTELKNALKSNIREISARVEINFSDISINPSVRVLASDQASPDSENQIINGNTEASQKWGCMDGITDMSGNYSMLPSISSNAYQVGLWSESITDINGDCDYTFNVTSFARNITKIKIYSDKERLEYFVDATISFYSESGLLGIETIIGNSSLIKEINIDYSDVTNIVYNITKYSTPFTNVKVVSIISSLSSIFSGDELISFDISEESEISGESTIPTGNISYSYGSLSLINKNRIFDVNNISSPLYKQLKPNSKIDLSLGANTSNGFEWKTFYSGWTEGFNSPENGIETTTSFFDRLKRLELSTISPMEVIYGKTVGEIFETILIDAGVSTEFRDVDLELFKSKYIVPIFFTTGQDHLTELRRVSQSFVCSVYSEDDVITVKSFESLALNFEVQESYGLSDYINKTNAPLYDTIFNEVQVNYSRMTEDANKNLYTTTSGDEEVVETGLNELTFLFNSQPCVNVAINYTLPVNVTITSEDLYSDRAIVGFTNTGETTSLSVSITGNPLIQQNIKTSIASDEESIQEYGKSEFKVTTSKLVQETDPANNISRNLVRTYANPFRDATIELSNAGNPFLSLTDKIAVVDRYSSQTYNIVKKEIVFDGGLSMNLSCRKDTTTSTNQIGYGLQSYGLGGYFG